MLNINMFISCIYIYLKSDLLLGISSQDLLSESAGWTPKRANDGVMIQSLADLRAL